MIMRNLNSKFRITKISLQCGIINPIFNKNRPYWIIKLIQYER